MWSKGVTTKILSHSMNIKDFLTTPKEKNDG